MVQNIMFLNFTPVEVVLVILCTCYVSICFLWATGHVVTVTPSVYIMDRFVLFGYQQYLHGNGLAFVMEMECLEIHFIFVKATSNCLYNDIFSCQKSSLQ